MACFVPPCENTQPKLDIFTKNRTIKHFLQSRVYKIHKNCIFHTHDYGYFTKIYYLCTVIQKRYKITTNI